MVLGHKVNGDFHPHQDKPGIHSSSVNHSTDSSPGSDKSGKKLVSISIKENNYWESRFKDAKQQNAGYEQLMDHLNDRIKEEKSEGHDPSYYENLHKEIVSAERARPHKSFDYDWITQVVEETIEKHPGISEQDLYLKARDVHPEITDERINRSIKHLEHDKAILNHAGHFKSDTDYIHNKDGRY